MGVPFFTTVREYAARKNEFDSAVGAVMERGDFILGKEVAEFEQEAASWLGVKYAVGLASGSDALVLAADILGFSAGAEVLTPTFTFFASASCVARLGGKPVFIDMDEETLAMDTAKAAERVTERTKGIIPVHLFQQTTPMQAVLDMAKKYGLSVLEDAAEAWGMENRVDGCWRRAGTMGDIGIFSFFPTKTIGAYGDAGLAVTDDEELHRKLKSYRVHGSLAKYQHDYIGYNSRLDTIQAAVLRVKLRSIEAAIAARARHAAHYNARLEGAPGIRIPKVAADNKPVFYVYNILIDDRDGLSAYLKEKGIGCTIYYPKPLHLQACFSCLGYKEGDFPVAESVSRRILALPIFPELSDDEVDEVCDRILAFSRKR
jgi:dTDP-4-amino-4,6-dideoxygalactose transaminase